MKEVKTNEIKVNVKTLAAYMDLSVSDLARKCNISENHLIAVMSGRAKMTAEDLTKLSFFTKVPIQNIEIALDKQ